MERREAWSAGPVFFVFLTGVIAPRHARYRALNRVERRLAAYVSYHIAALWWALAIVALATLASRLRLPYAVLLVLGGLLLGFVPGLPTITLNPELILVLFLPPLIYSSAWLTSWREFRASQQQLRREVLAAERAAIIGLRDQGRIDDETLRLVERELDLEEEQRLH